MKVFSALMTIFSKKLWIFIALKKIYQILFVEKKWNLPWKKNIYKIKTDRTDRSYKNEFR